MKILILSPNPSFGGGSTANQNIAKMIAMAGHDVVYADEFFDPTEEQPFEYSKLPVYKSRLIGKNKIVRYIKKNGFDLVICGVPQMMAFYMIHLLWLRIFHNVKVGIVFHSLCLGKNAKSRIFEQMIALSTLFVDKIFYVSDYTRVIWRKFWCLRKTSAEHHVIHNAVAEVEEKSVINTECPRISFVGRFSAEKRPQLFCKFADLLSDEFEFNLWGDGPMYDELKNTYYDKVNFMGYESNAQRIYSNTDILMMTSEFENCPMVILEARAYGIPVITVNVGGISEIVEDGHNGLFFNEADTASEIGEKIRKIVDNYSQFHENCLNSSITFEKITAKWNDAL